MRLTEKVFNRLKILAREYAGGDLTKWLTHGGLEAPRVYLTPKRKAAPKS